MGWVSPFPIVQNPPITQHLNSLIRTLKSDVSPEISLDLPAPSA